MTTADNMVTVTNSTSRVYGSFQITKAIDLAGPPASEPLQFTGTWSCTHAGDPDVTGTWQVDDAGTDQFSGVLVGSQCRITEDEPGQAPSSDPSYTWAGHTVDPASVTIGADSTPARLTVTNHTIRQLTQLRISKILEGDQAGEPAGKPYDMSYSCIDGSGVTHTGSNSIDSGESWTTDRVIPLGSTCTVTEGDLPDVSPRDTWGSGHVRHHPRRRRATHRRPGAGTRTAQSQSFVVPAAEDNAIVHVAVTNRLIRAQAGYLVSKTSDPPSGTTVDPGDTITYTLTVTPTGPGSTDGVVVTDDLSQVTPYAAVAIGDATQGTASLVGDTLTWNVGTVSGTTPLTLTYTATVDDGASGAALRNHVTASGEQPAHRVRTLQHRAPGHALVDPGEELRPTERVHRVTRHRHHVHAEGDQPLHGSLRCRPAPSSPTTSPACSTTPASSAWSTATRDRQSAPATRSRGHCPRCRPALPYAAHYTVHVDPGAFDVDLVNAVTGHGVTEPSSDCTAPSGTRLARAVATVSPGTCVTSTEHHTRAETAEVSAATTSLTNPDNGGTPGADVLAGTGAPPFLDWFLGAATLLLVGGLVLVVGSRRRRS